MMETYTKTALVPYYAFVSPVYDFAELDDLQVVDEATLCEMYAVYVYSIKTMTFRPKFYRDCHVDAHHIACKEHVRIAKMMRDTRHMTFSEETDARKAQLENGALDAACAEIMEAEE